MTRADRAARSLATSMKKLPPTAKTKRICAAQRHRRRDRAPTWHAGSQRRLPGRRPVPARRCRRPHGSANRPRQGCPARGRWPGSRLSTRPSRRRLGSANRAVARRASAHPADRCRHSRSVGLAQNPNAGSPRTAAPPAPAPMSRPGSRSVWRPDPGRPAPSPDRLPSPTTGRRRRSARPGPDRDQGRRVWAHPPPG